MAFTTYDEAAEKLREFLKDKAEYNTLDGQADTTDEDLVEYIKDTLNDINLTFEPKSRWTIADVVYEPGEDGSIPWSTVKIGATLQYLTAIGILSARNTLTYSDAGGVQVSDMDKWGRYINYYNVLVNKYVQGVTKIKTRLNVTAAYGQVVSPMVYNTFYHD